ncbi:NAD(P)H-binding protein [Actinosynnema pretiosum]|uniref:NADH-binding protein n=1 Tax=Actinosynnema pretiosum TaxID=42197 RepID=A0A290Z3K0_9PSEU|nr:NAD(P)H-binding protein [Actinosynnema pretiosum]ATE53523.1 NADH-binding protein [Actinosynnema pretiosum]
MRVLVTGASGFVGGRLCAALESAGHEVRAMTRRPDEYRGAGVPVPGDVTDERGLIEAARDCEVACYLVHGLSDRDYREADARAARSFARACAEAGVRRIVYLGGLGNGALSEHLRSRREVESMLTCAGVPVTVLRAAVVIGHGGASWKMLLSLVEHAPLILAPPEARTRCQPIAVADAVRYLVGAVETPETAGKTYEIGGPEVLEYTQMLRRIAALQGRSTLVLPLPVPLPRSDWLSAQAIAALSGVNASLAEALLGSLDTEVVVTEDNGITNLVPFQRTNYDDAVLTALGERAAENRTK